MRAARATILERSSENIELEILSTSRTYTVKAFQLEACDGVWNESR